MDFDQLEQEAIGLYQEGEFTAAKHLFDKLEQTSGTSREVHLFNKICCLAAEGETAQALGDLLATYEASSSSHSDLLCLYNIALCLLNLDRPDLTLAILDQIDQDENQTQVHPADLAHMLMHCTQRLNLTSGVSITQCKQIERLLINYKSEILDEPAWQRNMAHVLFLMDTRFEQCAKLLESLVPADGEESSIEGVDPTLLGNLCISYLLTSRNREAADLLKEIGREDQEKSRSSSVSSSPGPESTTSSSLVQVNLAIGTLYCVVNHYEFGLGQIFKSLEDELERGGLTCRAWAQVKRCILSALDKHCKQMIHIQDDLFDQIISFLIECETRCLSLVANEHKPIGEGKNSIAYEARHLRSILLTIVHD